MANEFKIKKGLIVTGASGGTVVDIQGSQGQLFSVTDNLSGSIFAVSDISGVPIFDVNSSGLVTVDGPFTQTGGGDSNFSGDIILQNSTPKISLIDTDAGDSFSVNNFTGNFVIKNDTDNIDSLIINGANNATFAGTIGSGSITSTGIITAATTFKTDSGSMLFFVPNVGQAFEIAQNTGDATFTTQAFATVATSSGDASSTLTTKGYVDGLITASTSYRGTWDPDVSLNSGYGNPNLSSVTQTDGYYYICSANGTATPNGTGNEPDSWNTGDWVVWNTDAPIVPGGGTGAWQKIDNTSVLSGIGTGQTVALWQGPNTVTDSETLGNAPITVSGNDTTFAGNVIAEGSLITRSVNANVTISGDTSGNIYYNNASGEHRWRADGSSVNSMNLSSTLLTVNENATFTGTVTVNTSNSGILTLNRTTSAGGYMRFQNDGTDKFYIGSRGTVSGSGGTGYDIYAVGGNDIRFFPGTLLALTLDTSANATFAGTLTVEGADAITIPDYILHAGDDSKFGFPSNDNFKVRLAGTDKFTMSATINRFSNIQNAGSRLELYNNRQDAGNVEVYRIAAYNQDEVAGIHFYRGSGGSSGYTKIFAKKNNASSLEEVVQFGTNNALTTTFTSNVGIGTTSPDAILETSKEVDGNQVGALLTNTRQAGTADSVSLNFGLGRTADGYIRSVDSIKLLKEQQWTGTPSTVDAALVFSTVQNEVVSERARITSTGHLQVSTGYFELTSQPTTKLWLSTNQAQLYAGGLLVFAGYNSSNDAVVVGNETGDINVTLAGGANNKVLYLEGSSGNVGIGTKTPLAKLDIQGTQGQLFSVTDDLSGSIFAVSDISGVPIFDVNSSGVSYFDGNVGIGVTNPVAALNIGNNGNIRIDGNTSGGGIYASSNGSNNTFSLTRQDGVNVGDLSISGYSGVGITGGRTSSPATSGYSFYVKSDGNVGIGTTSPDSKLEIVGNNPILTIRDSDTSTSTATSTIRFAESNASDTLGNYWDVGYSPVNMLNFDFNGSTKMTINSSGNVGIGVTAPAQKLHVGDGGIRVEKFATGLGGFITIGNATETAGNYSAYFFGNTPSDTDYFKVEVQPYQHI